MFNDKHMSYLIWEKEVAPSTGTCHIQGYIRLVRKQSMSTTKLLLTDRAHLERAKGTEEENRVYCSKEREGNDWAEEGTFQADEGKQGRRTDLDAVSGSVMSGACNNFFLNEVSDRNEYEGVGYEASGGVYQVPWWYSNNEPVVRSITPFEEGDPGLYSDRSHWGWEDSSSLD